MKEIKILQYITDKESKSLLVFTENPEKDIEVFVKEYEDEDKDDYYLGYEKPTLIDFEFLGRKTKTISLWYDNEDIPNHI